MGGRKLFFLSFSKIATVTTKIEDSQGKKKFLEEVIRGHIEVLHAIQKVYSERVDYNSNRFSHFKLVYFLRHDEIMFSFSYWPL